jgi:alkyl sulfatase BDS1-like metallo-beta-lactamase superfamily hydrolase
MDGNLHVRFAAALCGLAMAASQAHAQLTSKVPSKPASDSTRSANARLLESLPFADRQDFEDAQRGFIGRPEKLTIRDANGKVVWDLESYKPYLGLDKPAPDTVNPSLWRNAQLNMLYGLFKVSDRIYQVRGYDLSNISFIQGDTGWIVLDPLISSETAKAAYDLVTEHLGQRPVKAVIYSHSHIDHYGGVRGVVDEADVQAGRVKIIAPEGFLEHAVSENVIAGNAMSRRAVFMYGALLPRNAQGGVNAGLGQANSMGTVTLIPPTDTITSTGQELTIDGVRMVFQMTPGTEAPAEMNTWFPQFKALWMAENTTNTLHNILTLRGAQVRDAQRWAHYINETIQLYGSQADVKFQAHHWPVWGNARIGEYLEKQRDVYKYMHDQTVRLLNEGHTGTEIAEMLELPPGLQTNWATRGYYGTLSHNTKAIYQRYMGWYDGNPANLHTLPPEPAAKKYVEYMGGEAALLARARADFAKGEYRWVAEALKHAVFANPENAEAKGLLADALEQMGYQAESGPWRSVYLQGAYELRNGTPQIEAVGSASPDVIRSMPPEMLFDYLSVRLNGPEAVGRKLSLNFDFTDLGKAYGLTVANGVLNYGPPTASPDVALQLRKSTLDAIQLKQVSMQEAVQRGDVVLQGRREAFQEFLELLDSFPHWFNIVTP